MVAAATTVGAAVASLVAMAAAPAPAAGTEVEPENPTVLVSVTLVHKKKCTKKSDRPMRDDNEPWSSQEQEKEAESQIITWSLSLSELQYT